jgi:hypothetical protein
MYLPARVRASDIAHELAIPVMKVSVGGKKLSVVFVDNNPDAVLREKYLKYIAAVAMRITTRRHDRRKYVSPRRPYNYSDCCRCGIDIIFSQWLG